MTMLYDLMQFGIWVGCDCMVVRCYWGKEFANTRCEACCGNNVVAKIFAGIVM